MKKLLFVPALVLLLCGGLFGADFSLSAGTGGIVGGYFTRYKSSSNVNSGEVTQNVNQFNYGGLAFLDATYGELAVSYQAGSNNYKEVAIEDGEMQNMEGNGWATSLGLSLLGKYPFNFARRMHIFPLLGMEYKITLSERRQPDGGITYDRTNGVRETDIDGNAYELSTWNSFWIQVGFGADLAIMKNVYLRGEFLYGFRLMTSYERDGLEKLKEFLGDSDPKLGGLTSGPSFKLCAGYRFLSL